MSALLITAPVGSVTKPLREPVPAWPQAAIVAMSSSRATPILRRRVENKCIVPPSRRAPDAPVFTENQAGGMHVAGHAKRRVFNAGGRTIPLAEFAPQIPYETR